MKAFTVFMFLPASATADGVLSHESILWFHGSSSISLLMVWFPMEKFFHCTSMKTRFIKFVFLFRYSWSFYVSNLKFELFSANDILWLRVRFLIFRIM